MRLLITFVVLALLFLDASVDASDEDALTAVTHITAEEFVSVFVNEAEPSAVEAAQSPAIIAPEVGNDVTHLIAELNVVSAVEAEQNPAIIAPEVENDVTRAEVNVVSAVEAAQNPAVITPPEANSSDVVVVSAEEKVLDPDEDQASAKLSRSITEESIPSDQNDVTHLSSEVNVASAVEAAPKPAVITPPEAISSDVVVTRVNAEEKVLDPHEAQASAKLSHSITEESIPSMSIVNFEKTKECLGYLSASYPTLVDKLYKRYCLQKRAVAASLAAEAALAAAAGAREPDAEMSLLQFQGSKEALGLYSASQPTYVQHLYNEYLKKRAAMAEAAAAAAVAAAAALAAAIVAAAAAFDANREAELALEFVRSQGGGGSSGDGDSHK